LVHESSGIPILSLNDVSTLLTSGRRGISCEHTLCGIGCGDRQPASRKAERIPLPRQGMGAMHQGKTTHHIG
jgi:hypothetical protein